MVMQLPLRFLVTAMFAGAVLAAGVAPAPVAHAVDASDSGEVDDPGAESLDKARSLIESGDWRSAIATLEQARSEAPDNADVYNLLGFANRKLDRFDESLKHYIQALSLNPEHRGALEYLGELYVQTGRMADARKIESRLAAACPRGCEELADLRKVLAGKAD